MLKHKTMNSTSRKFTPIRRFIPHTVLTLFAALPLQASAFEQTFDFRFEAKVNFRDSEQATFVTPPLPCLLYTSPSPRD